MILKQHTNNVLAAASEDEEITEGQIHMQSEQACSPAAFGRASKFTCTENHLDHCMANTSQWPLASLTSTANSKADPNA